MPRLLQQKHLAAGFGQAVYTRRRRPHHRRSAKHRNPASGVNVVGWRSAASENLSAIRQLLLRVQAECPGKDVWMWTGYILDELTVEQQEVTALINVLVDGKFVQELKDPSLIWRGSGNQVIHYLR